MAKNDKQRFRSATPSPRLSSWVVAAMFGMIAVPAYFTLHTARVSSPGIPISPNPSPYGYTVSLLLFIIPIIVIAFWFIPREEIRISRKAFWWTIGILFPLGALLDFLFASRFFLFPNPGATLGIKAPALGNWVPVEEYIFYFTGFIAVLLLYIWLDEYWLSAYTVPGSADDRTDFDRLLRFHPESLFMAAALIAFAFLYRRIFAPALPGFPEYFLFLVLGALLPSSILFPSARPVINWRALSLTMFMILLISLLWEVTLALPLRLVELSGRRDARLARHRLGAAPHRRGLRLGGGHLRYGDRLRDREALEGVRQACKERISRNSKPTGHQTLNLLP